MANILGLCGSLRKASVNRAFLGAFQQLLPDGSSLEIYPDLGQIPIFNPDDEPRPPKIVKQLRQNIRAADAIIIASPEYAHGVTGVMKNALDWMVASGEFMSKPVAVPNCSFRATIAHTAMFETLRVMDAWMIIEASDIVPLANNSLTTEQILANEDYTKPMSDMLTALLAVCSD